MRQSRETGAPATRAAPEPVSDPVNGPPDIASVRPTVRHRLRLMVVCAGLVTLAFFQAPGLVVADTKLDLVVAPTRFLQSALHLWDPQHDFGRLQDQVVGYLFPMGPVFAAGHALHVPAWVIQRSWLAALLILAFLGAVRVSTRLGVRGSWPVIVAGALYVAAPRALSLAATNSSELIPWALAPWALVTLLPRTGPITRRNAARSGLVVAAMGGINAAAVAAVLPLSALWLLTRRWSWRLARIGGWWLLALGLATAWWLVPLLLQARYGFGFLPYTESAVTTTSHTSPGESLRGVSDWVGYLGVSGQPWLRAGWWLSTDAVAAVFTAVAAAGGAAGLALPRVPHRRFLVLTLTVGLVAVTLGHVGELSPMWSPSFQHLLDGAFAPLRNTHKFDPLIRLPLAVGLGHLVSRATVLLPGRLDLPARRFAAFGAAAVVAVVAWPAVTADLPSRGSFAGVPAYWQDAADWLDAHAGQTTTLALPASGFGEYTWGRPLDEPLAALSGTGSASRTVIPLGSTGEIRVLDAVERVVDSGQPSAGLAAFLRRAGVQYVLVRNDLDRAASGAPWPVLVHASLDRSPGLVPVAQFGPTVGQTVAGAAALQYSGDLGLDVGYPALEIYRVDGAGQPVSVYPAAGAVALSGGPESLLQLASSGALRDRATVLSADDPSGLTLSSTVVTDGLRRREVNFGLVRYNSSATLAATDPFRIGAPAHDYLPVPGVEHQTVGGMADESVVSASSSAADASVIGFIRGPQFKAANAFDDDPSTAWLSSPDQSVVGQWVRLGLPTTVTPTQLALRLVDYPTQPHIDRLTISTDAGSEQVRPQAGGGVQVFPVPPGPTQSVTLLVDSVRGPHPIGTVVGIVDVSMPPSHPEWTLTVPSDSPAPGPTTYDFALAPGSRRSCVPTPGLVICQPLLNVPGEETRLDRTFQVPTAESVGGTGWVLPQPGSALDALLATVRSTPTVAASSSQVLDPEGNATAAVDGDPRTAWIAGGDPNVTYTLSWPRPRTLSSFQFVDPAGLPASPPEVIDVRTTQGDQSALVDDHGTATLSPVRTSFVSISFPRTFQRYSAALGQAPVPLPVGFAELRVNGDTNVFTDAATPVRLPCGHGPAVTVDGTSHATAVRGSLGGLVAGGLLRLRVCGDGLSLSAGSHRVVAAPTRSFAVSSLTLTPDDIGTSSSAGTSRVSVTATDWGTADRTVTVTGNETEPVLLDVHENDNAGWVATADGKTLTAVRLDGWQQGWLVPAGVATVHLTYRPDSLYRAGLVGSAVLLVVLVVLAVLPSRRPRSGVRWQREPGRRQQVVEVVAMLALGVLAGGIWFVLAVAVAGALRLLRAGRWLPLVAAIGVLVTAWPALPTVTAPGAIAVAWPARAATAAALLALSVIVVAAVPARDRGRAHRKAAA